MVHSQQDAAKTKANNAFFHYVHLEEVVHETDHAVVRCEVKPEHKNPYGMVHGGLLATMADNAAGLACHTDGRVYVTQNCSMNFVSNVQSGIIQAESRVLHRGHKTCLCSVEIYDEQRKLLLTGQYTMFCVGVREKSEG